MTFSSQKLNQILDFGHINLDDEIELSALANEVIETFDKKKLLVKALLEKTSGKIKAGKLGLHLIDILKYDSVVRDLNTTGHLAKILSRLEVFHKTLDCRIFGMPNKVFDERSQIERAKFFETGKDIFIAEEDFFELPNVQKLMDREAEIYQRFENGK